MKRAIYWTNGAFTAPWAAGVGYGQLINVLEDQFPLDDAVREWKQASRRYAKRQETWFRNQTVATWLDATQRRRRVGRRSRLALFRGHDN